MDDVIERDVGTLPAIAPQTAVAVTPMRLLEIATQQGADIDKLKQLMDLQERWEKNVARKAFDAAVSAAKSDIPIIFKNREVDFTSQKGRTNYRYEDFAEVARVVDPILAKHGLSYRFRTSSKPGEPIIVACILAHRDGHCEETTLDAARDDSGNKNGIQAIGSTITYLQRYTLKAALGLAASSDSDARTPDAPTVEPDPDGKAKLEACGSQAALKAAWGMLTPQQRKTLGPTKDKCKAAIEEADKEAAAK